MAVPTTWVPTASKTIAAKSRALAERPRRALLVPMAKVTPAGKVGIFVNGKIRYVVRPTAGGYVAPPPAPAKKTKTVKVEKLPPGMLDPKSLTAARELRDRYLAQANRAGTLLPAGKYDISRRLVDTGGEDELTLGQPTTVHLLGAA